MKRFYKNAAVGEADDGFHIVLDGKVLKTPARANLVVPSVALAEAIAGEWGSAAETIDPQTMPLTRLAFAAIDSVAHHRDKIVHAVTSFGHSDLLCYRAEAPQELIARQAAAWDSMLDWAAERYGAQLTVTSGISHAAQPENALAALERAVQTHDDFALAALHTAASITSSLVLALALSDSRLNAGVAFAIATIDESFQAEKWGRDAEADARLARLLSELSAAEHFLRLLA